MFFMLFETHRYLLCDYSIFVENNQEVCEKITEKQQITDAVFRSVKMFGHMTDGNFSSVYAQNCGYLFFLGMLCI